MSLSFITGGVRSGKSAFAEQLVAASQSVLYVAFGVVTDEEMQQRIDAHRRRRPVTWGVWEGTTQFMPPEEIYCEYDVMLVDCLSTWLTNYCVQIPEHELKNPLYREQIRTEAIKWLKAVQQSRQHVIVVSSEVGLGGVAMSPLGRFFQDMLGEINQLTAQHANEVYTVLSGIPLRLKG